MDLSLCLDTGRPWDDVSALARAADDAGVHALYVSDHLMPFAPVGEPADAPVLEAWTMLTAVATVTESARIGTLVLGNTLRHPAVVAKMATTLDHVSRGRLVLGLGAGWQENEHAANGIPLPPVTERLDRFAETVEAVTLLLHVGGGTLAGRYVQLDGASCQPRPLQQRLPVLIGGAGGPGSLPDGAPHPRPPPPPRAPLQVPRPPRGLARPRAAAGRAPRSV